MAGSGLALSEELFTKGFSNRDALTRPMCALVGPLYAGSMQQAYCCNLLRMNHQ